MNSRIDDSHQLPQAITNSRPWRLLASHAVLEKIAAAAAAHGRKLMILSDFSRLCLAHRSLTLLAVMLLPPLE